MNYGQNSDDSQAKSIQGRNLPNNYGDLRTRSSPPIHLGLCRPICCHCCFCPNNNHHNRMPSTRRGASALPRTRGGWTDFMLAMVGFNTGGALYWLSLEPQPSQEEMQANLPRLAAFAAISALSFVSSFVFAICAFSPVTSAGRNLARPVFISSSSLGRSEVRTNRRKKLGWATLAYGALLLTGLMLVDRGNTLDSHGAFNQLFFFIFFVPTLCLSLSIRYSGQNA